MHLAPANRKRVLTASRTIHGMVYNAMKLFMEVNPQLFDDCSHEYTESQNNAESVKAARQAKWDRLADMAKAMQNGHAPPVKPAISNHSSKVASPMRADNADPLSQDGTRRLEQLRIQDDRLSGQERRPSDYEGRLSGSVR